ncbi:hypothetical protein ACFO5R_06555 [Halosolutus amylolyticus]|uniref:Uncharacterized protein n=1 Tax=Halosolutus amylolyticus TaxID=2932267 RepID=A0ABD5PMI0_9EURY|nr:hypothetical protein [Halosolutus amylolyticus]
MSDDRPPDDPDDRAGGPTAPSDDSPADEPTSYREDGPADDPADRVGDAHPDDAPDEPPREGQANGGYSDERSQETAEGEHAAPPEEPRDTETETGTGGLSDRAAFWISALIGVVLSVGSIALVSGQAPFFEDLLRVRPTVEGGGVGADWVVGNTEPVLEWLIVLVHFADVVLGIFILVILFIHWAAFRRLAARMQPPGARTRTRETTTATDGGGNTATSGGASPREGSTSPDDRSSEPPSGGDPT